MSSPSPYSKELLESIKAEYESGGNVSRMIRHGNWTGLGDLDSTLEAAILLAYDLQAGSYVRAAEDNPAASQQWCSQLAAMLEPLLGSSGSLLEVGVGEATTLAGVLELLGSRVVGALGFDASWSRIRVGKKWLRVRQQTAELFVAQMAQIPLENDSIDVVYSSHSLEPNRGIEERLLSECLRVARRYVVLFEPIYELAHKKARERMDHHGYVRNLRGAAIAVGAEVQDFRLLEYSPNPMNPSGVIVLQKRNTKEEEAEPTALETWRPFWSCPVSHEPMRQERDLFSVASVGLIYPVVRDIPLLTSQSAIVASGHH